jgi:hypothetical protein
MAHKKPNRGAGDAAALDDDDLKPTQHTKNASKTQEPAQHLQGEKEPKLRGDEFPVYLWDATELRGVIFERDGVFLAVGSTDDGLIGIYDTVLEAAGAFTPREAARG